METLEVEMYHTPIRNFNGDKRAKVSLACGAFLRSEMKWSKLLVQPPHHVVTCAHHKKCLTVLNKLRLLWYILEMMYICLRFPTSVIIIMLLNLLYSSLCLTPQNLKSLVHRISNYGKCKVVDLVVINFLAYFLHISIRLFINLPWIVQVNLDFN